MSVDKPASVRAGGPLLFLLGSSKFSFGAEWLGGEAPAELIALNTPSHLFNKLSEVQVSRLGDEKTGRFKLLLVRLVRLLSKLPPINASPVGEFARGAISQTRIRAVYAAGDTVNANLMKMRKFIRRGDFVAFGDDSTGDADTEFRERHLRSLIEAVTCLGAKPVLITQYSHLLAEPDVEENPHDFNDAMRRIAKNSGALLCDIDSVLPAAEKILKPWGTSLLNASGLAFNAFGIAGMSILLYRCVTKQAPEIQVLGELFKNAWFKIRGIDNVPLHFRADKLLPIFSAIGDEEGMNRLRSKDIRNVLSRSRTDTRQYIQCAPMSRNGVHLLMGILSHLGAFCHFGKLDEHYENRDGILCLNGMGRNFVTTFATDMALYDERIEAKIPLQVEFSHRLNDSLFQEKWIRSVRDPRDMLVSIHDLAPVKFVSGKAVPIEETLEVPLPNAGGCIFGLGAIEEWVLQESFLYHVVPSTMLCHVYFEKIKTDGLTEITRLLEFMGYEAEQKHIEEALSANKAEAVRPYGKLSPSGGKVGHWRSRDFANKLDRRYSLAASILKNSHDYSIGEYIPQAVSWPEEIFSEAHYARVNSVLHNLKKRFPSSSYELFRAPLTDFAQLASEFPLLEIQLADALLSRGKHVAHATEILSRWAAGELWGPRFMALIALAKHDDASKTHLESSLVEAHSTWRRTKHPMIRQIAMRMGFSDDGVLSAYDRQTSPSALT